MLPRFLTSSQARNLLWVLFFRESVSRYKRSVLGIGWALAEPLAMGLTYFVVFQKFARVDVPQYPVFLLSGLLPWTFLQGVLQHSSGVMLENSNLLRKVAFPREVLVVAKAMSQAINMVPCVLLLMLAGAFLGPETQPGWHSLLLVPGVFLLLVFAVSVGAALSVLTPRLHDVPHLIQFGMRLAVYATPVVYTPAMVPADFRPLLLLNPMAGILEFFRAGMLRDTHLDVHLLAWSGAVTALVCLASWRIFARLEPNIAEAV